MPTTRTVNLVLGAGGAAGWVFHAGVLAALRETLGWDPQSAHLIVGTSAGSAVAAATRAGVEPTDIVHLVREGPSEEERAAYIATVREQRRTLRPLSPRLLGSLVSGGGIAIAAAGLLPPGLFPTDPLGDFPGLRNLDAWPPGLWIPAVRASDGATVVFGRDRTDIEVREAVEASSAVPALFRPKEIDGTSYIDGGLASSTHAHLAAVGNPDVVIISAPLIRPGKRPMSVLAHRSLMREKAALLDAGIFTTSIQPPAEAGELFRGFPRRDPHAADDIAALARAATIAAVIDSRLGRVLIDGRSGVARPDGA